MAAGRNWADIKQGLTALTQEEKEALDFQVRLVGEILDARKGLGITQAELDELSGVAQTHIARIETRRTDPQISTILKILRPLGKTLAVVDAATHYAPPTDDPGQS